MSLASLFLCFLFTHNHFSKEMYHQNDADNNQLWHWSEQNGFKYLVCDLLKDWQHGFFGKFSYPHLPEDLIAALEPQASVYRVKQVHGNSVLKTQDIQPLVKSSNHNFAEADGIITNDFNQSVWVASADCNPVLIADRQTKKVAALHAGWRGTAKRIISEAIALFQAEGSNLADLRVAIGPAIAGEVYQVGVKVAAEVGRSIVEDPEIADESIVNHLLAIDNSPLLPDEHPARVKLDVRKVNQIQLLKLGLSNSQIAIAPFCTFQQPDYFFSYRKTNQKKVQWSGIVS